MSFSKVILMGNLVADPEQRTIPSGRNVTGLTIAVSRRFRSADGEVKEEVSYVDCDAWGGIGDVINRYFTKGQAILVSGRIRQDRWTDKETGKTRSTLRVVVEDFSFVSSGRAAGVGNSYTSDRSYSKPVNNNDADVDELSPIAAEDIPVIESVPINSEIKDDQVDLDDVPF